MNNSEKYYRRAFNALQKLIKAYKNGYTPQTMNEFRTSLILSGVENQTLMKEEQLSIMYTLTIALLGLNKESIEKSEKITEYKQAAKGSIGLEPNLNRQQQTRKQEFNDKRTVETPFDNWLSIVKDLTKDQDAQSIMKKIRNGILHSNFELLLESGNLDYTNIKIKSYFEAELLNLEFEKYVFEYFSNIEGLGLTEKLFTYNIRFIDIKDKEILRKVLEEMSINALTYRGIKTLEDKTPEDHLMDSRNGDVIDIDNFFKQIKDSSNFEDVKGELLKLKPETIRLLEDYIHKTFGNNFYKMPQQTQMGIISTTLNYIINPKREISNWFAHFWYFYSTLTTNKVDTSFYSGDEFGFESCYPSLLVLKAYLIMYRLQNKDFDNIDYTKVNFPLDGTIQIISGNINDPESDENTFVLSMEKETQRNPNLTYEETFHKVMCDVVRNSLAHGNVNVYLSPLSLENKIELTDIDPKTGRVRRIIFDESGFEKFLSSDAFLPKNCYNKENSSSLKKDI